MNPPLSPNGKQTYKQEKWLNDILCEYCQLE